MGFVKNMLGVGSAEVDGSAEVRPITTTADGKIWLEFYVHVQEIADQRVSEGKHLVSFPGKRIEGFEICHTIPDVEIKCMGHVQDVGDTAWKSCGNFIGTRGQSRRLEGFAVRLEGKAADDYDVKYYVQMRGIHCSTIAQNGQFAGTRGQSRQIEGLAIWLEPRQKEMVYYAEFAGPQKLKLADLKSDGSSIDELYKIECSTPSDIWEHLPTLYKYSLGCSEIAELGVRDVVSTWAFLKALKDSDVSHKKLLCVDLVRSEIMDTAIAAAAISGIELEFVEKNDLMVDLKDGVDLLFIDTWHVYPQLKRELELHAPKVRKYIAMHDTTVDETVGESVRCGMDIAAQARESGFSEADIRTGLGKAVKEFIATHPEWKIKEVFTNCNGLTVFERVSTSTPSADST